jgi:hypothetical protein
MPPENGGSFIFANDDPANRPGSKITVSCWVKLTEYHGVYLSSDSESLINPSGGGKWNTFVHKKYNNNMSEWGVTRSSFEISTDVYTDCKRGDWYARVSVLSPSPGGLYVNECIIKTAGKDSKYRIPLNTWCLLSLTYDKSTGIFRSYFNDQLVDSMSEIAYSNGGYYIGYSPVSDGSSFYPFKPVPGFIDDVRIESTARDQDYIIKMYNKAKYLLDSGNDIHLDMDLTSENIVSSIYPRNSRIYAETWGALTLAQNAKWDSANKNWKQENNSFPSSLVFSKPVISYSSDSTESYNFNCAGVLSKRSGTNSAWTGWDKTDFVVNSGTSALLSDTSKTLSFTNVFMGPYNGAGYSQLFLRGNTNRGGLENQTGGPRIKIDKSYPSPDNIDTDSLYSANIPKAFLSFYANSSEIDETISTTGLPTGGFGVRKYKARINNAFNISSVLYETDGNGNKFFRVQFVHRLFTPSIACKLSVQSTYSYGSSQFKDAMKCDVMFISRLQTNPEPGIDLYIVNKSTGEIIDPFGYPMAGTVIFNLIAFE